jgi:hypothetical protein
MKKKELPIDFKLLGIKIEQFAVIEENYSSKKEVKLLTQLQFKLNEGDKQIGVFLGFEFLQPKKIFIKLLVSCHFTIQENSWNNFLDKTKNKIVIPKNFLSHITMITTGTSRGVLFAKTENTILSKFIIPTLNVNEMIDSDITFEITK